MIAFVAIAEFGVQDAGIVAALVAGVAGAGVAIWKVGPERSNIIVTYQTEVLDNLRDENARLLGRNAELAERVECLEAKYEQTEAEVKEERQRRRDLERRLEALEARGIEFRPEEMGTRADDPPSDS